MDSVFVTDRTTNERLAVATVGPVRKGGTKGRRVRIRRGAGIWISVYPADARKVAMQLLDLADECERA